MKDIILKYLGELEQTRDIKILLACETGSRAWGFPSPDSDYDVRLIYVHRPLWYLKLTEPKDTIEQMHEDREIDISGWDLRKSLRLLMKSNPPLLERIQSPIVYQADPVFVAGINSLADGFYSRIATINHYLSMSNKMMAELNGGENYKLKKLFYALRTAVACNWIMEKEEKPPIEFPVMLAGLDIDSTLQKSIHALITLKLTKDETYMHSGEEHLLEFIEDTLQKATQQRNALPGSNGNVEELSDFFIKTLKTQWTSIF